MLHGRTNHEIWENETSVWQLEASTGSGDINGAIKRILSKLPNDFPERLQKLPKSHVSLSIAVVQSGRFQCLKLANGNLAKLKAIGASLQILLFSQKQYSKWKGLRS